MGESVSGHRQPAGPRPRSRRREHRALGFGVGGAVLAWGAAAATGVPTAHADVLDAVIDPVVSAATAAVTQAVESTVDVTTATAIDLPSLLDLGSIAGTVADVSHAAALPVEAASSAAIDPLATSAASAASLDELVNQFLQQTVQQWMVSPLGSAIDEQLINPIAMAVTGHDLIATNTAGALDDSVALAAVPDHASVPLTVLPTGSSDLGLNGIVGQVTISVNGGPETPVTVDTGSSGLLITLDKIGWQNLGFPTGFETVNYGTAELGDSIFAANFTAPIDFGNGIVTAPTEITVPLFTTVHETLGLVDPIDLGPFGVINSVPLNFGFPDIPPFTTLLNAPEILGIGAAGLQPSNPVTEALPGDLGQGVLINVPGHTLEFGPNPLTPDTIINGNPLATLQVQIGDGPLKTVTTAIDSGGNYGNIPASLLSPDQIVPVTDGAYILENEVAPGTLISVYTPGGELLYQFTTTADATPSVTSSGDLFNTGLTPFLNQPVFIGYGPNDGSPGITGAFTPDVGFTIFDR